MRARSVWLILEAILSYAVPAYFWIIGLFWLPFLLWTAASMEPADVVGILVPFFAGLSALFGLAGLLTVAISREPVSVTKLGVLALLSGCGVLGIWSTVTGNFESFDVEPLTLVGTIAPTACTLHLLVLCSNQILLKTRTR